MWSVVDLSHIENLRNNSCEYRLYIIIPHQKNYKTIHMDVGCRGVHDIEWRVFLLDGKGFWMC